MSKKYVLTYVKGPNLTQETFDTVTLDSLSDRERRARIGRLRDRFVGWVNDIESREYTKDRKIILTVEESNV